MVLVGFIFLAAVGASAWVLFGKDMLANLKNELAKAKVEENIE
jgi:hypothetical protein